MTFHTICYSTAIGRIRALTDPADAGVVAWRNPDQPGQILFSRSGRLFPIGYKVKVYIGTTEAGDTAYLTEIGPGAELATTNTDLTPFLYIRVYITDLAGSIITNAVVQTLAAVGEAVTAPTAAGALPDLTLTQGVAMEPADLSVDFDNGGGTNTYTLAPTSAALPAGLSLAAAGILSGTPTETVAGRSIVVRGDNGVPPAADSGFSLSVEAAVAGISNLTLQRRARMISPYEGDTAQSAADGGNPGIYTAGPTGEIERVDTDYLVNGEIAAGSQVLAAGDSLVRRDTVVATDGKSAEFCSPLVFCRAINTGAVSDQTAIFGSQNTAGSGPFQIVSNDGEPISGATVTGGTAIGFILRPDGVIVPDADGSLAGQNGATIIVSCDGGTLTVTLDIRADEFAMRDLLVDGNSLNNLRLFDYAATIKPRRFYREISRSVGRRGRSTADLIDARAEAEAGTTPGLYIGSKGLTIGPEFPKAWFHGYRAHETLNIEGWSGRIYNCAIERLEGGADINTGIEVFYYDGAHVDLEDSDFTAPDFEPTFGSGIIGQRSRVAADGYIDAYSSIDVRRIYLKHSNADPCKAQGADAGRRQIIEHCYFGPGGILDGPWLGAYDDTRGYAANEYVDCPPNPDTSIRTYGIWKAKTDLAPGIAPPNVPDVFDPNWIWSDIHADGVNTLTSEGGILISGCFVDMTNVLFPGRSIKPNNCIRVVQNNSGEAADLKAGLRGVRIIGNHLMRSREPSGQAQPVDLVTPFNRGFGADPSETQELRPEWANIAVGNWLDPQGKRSETDLSPLGAYLGSALDERPNTVFIGNRNAVTGQRLEDFDGRSSTDPLKIMSSGQVGGKPFVTFDRQPIITQAGLTTSGDTIIADTEITIAAGAISDGNGNTNAEPVTFTLSGAATGGETTPPPSTDPLHAGSLGQSEGVVGLMANGPYYTSGPYPDVLPGVDVQIASRAETDKSGTDIIRPVTQEEADARNLNPGAISYANLWHLGSSGRPLRLTGVRIVGTSLQDMMDDDDVDRSGAADQRIIDFATAAFGPMKRLTYNWYHNESGQSHDLIGGRSGHLLGLNPDGTPYDFATGSIERCLIDAGGQGKGMLPDDCKLDLMLPGPEIIGDSPYTLYDPPHVSTLYETPGNYVSNVKIRENAIPAVAQRYAFRDFTPLANRGEVTSSAAIQLNGDYAGGSSLPDPAQGYTHPSMQDKLGQIRYGQNEAMNLLIAEGYYTKSRHLRTEFAADGTSSVFVFELGNGGTLTTERLLDGLAAPDRPHAQQVMGFQIVRDADTPPRADDPDSARRDLYRADNTDDALYPPHYRGTATIVDTGSDEGGVRVGKVQIDFVQPLVAGDRILWAADGSYPYSILHGWPDYDARFLLDALIEHIPALDDGTAYRFPGLAIEPQVRSVTDLSGITPDPGTWAITGSTIESAPDAPATPTVSGSTING